MGNPPISFSSHFLRNYDFHHHHHQHNQYHHDHRHHGPHHDHRHHHNLNHYLSQNQSHLLLPHTLPNAAATLELAKESFSQVKEILAALVFTKSKAIGLKITKQILTRNLGAPHL